VAGAGCEAEPFLVLYDWSRHPFASCTTGPASPAAPAKVVWVLIDDFTQE
jgi:hypothetical protein